MKNLNKKIGVVALAAMMLVGGVVVSGVSVQAAPIDGGPLSLENMSNAEDYNFVKEVCASNNVVIAAYDKDYKKIDKYVDGEFGAKPELKRRLYDISAGFKHGQKAEFRLYIRGLRKLKDKDPHAKSIYRVKYGIMEYIIQVK